MPRITYISFDGTEHAVTAEAGTTAMQAAVHHGVPGIDGDCGGVAACGTCHVYVDRAWLGRTGPAREGVEQDMLAFADGVADNSRLACQIKLDAELDGLVLRLPLGQH